MPITHRVFISYSWDDDRHKKWVIKLATHLRQDGVDIHLDYWLALPGDELPDFMEREIREAEKVIIVCTPGYKRKSEARTGGVGYEGSIIAAQIFAQQSRRKFIPVLARGAWRESAASWLIGKSYVDLSDNSRYATGYKDLLSTILGTLPKPPLLGPKPPAYKSSDHSTFIEPDLEYSPEQNPNVVIFDSQGVIYGQKLLRHCIETDQTVKAIVFRGISIEVLMAYLQTRFSNCECIHKLKNADLITPENLETISENVQLTVADAMYMWEFQKRVRRP